MKKLYTTIVVGQDGREFDLSKTRFPKTETYLPVNAFTREVREESGSGE